MVVVKEMLARRIMEEEGLFSVHDPNTKEKIQMVARPNAFWVSASPKCLNFFAVLRA